MAWVSAKVSERIEWAKGLITLRLDTVVTPFVPGQFVNLALDIGADRIKRSYSVASAPGQPSEFYLALVPGGALTPALFERGPGQEVWLDDRPLGFFTLDHVPPARHLWLLATGTGLGPFLSMLRSPTVWERFERIALVHGVRQVSHLGYGVELSAYARERPGQFAYLPLISREAPPLGGLAGRLPPLIASGELERELGLTLSPADSHVLLCGNPAMISDVQQVLGERGLVKHRPRKPGHISFESYW